MLSCLLVTALLAGPPLIRTAGLHLLDTAGRCRWLGPGGHPTVAPDGRSILVEAHHGALPGPPAGPVYRIALSDGAATEVQARYPLTACRFSPSGQLLAGLLASETSPLGFVLCLRADTGTPVGSPAPLGPLTEGRRQAFAWLPGERLAVAVPRAAAGFEAGVWLFEPATAQQHLLAAVEGADGLWPTADGGALAVRLDGGLARLTLAPPAPLESLWRPAAGVELRQVKWAADGTLWLVTREADGVWLQQWIGPEHPLRGWPLSGEPLSEVGWWGERAVYLARDGDRAAVVALALADGRSEILATLAEGVPGLPHPAWPAPAPLPLPDGRGLLVSLGRTDRYGLRDADVGETTDVDVTGRTVTVVRRSRNVGSSGVVFESAELAFAGRERPRPDGGVATTTRAGTMRWQRPAPPRWVVLHHTGTTSDAGSLNALTSPAAGRLAQLYADLTPAARIPAEPRTIGVHYVALRDGGLVQLAEERYVTRHAGTGQWRNTGPVYDFNVETIGIEIVGRGNDFTAAQIRSVGRLVTDICRRQAIPLEQIGGRRFVEGVLYHKDFAGGLRGKPDPAGWPWEAMLTHARADLTN